MQTHFFRGFLFLIAIMVASSASAITDYSHTKFKGKLIVNITGTIVKVRNQRATAQVQITGIDNQGDAVDFIGVLQFQGDVQEGSDLLTGKGRSQFIGTVTLADGTVATIDGTGKHILAGSVTTVVNSDGSLTRNLNAQGEMQFQGDVLDGTDL